MLDCWRNLDSAGVDVAQDVPPVIVVRECGVFHAGDEPLYTEEIINFGEVGIWEGMPSETAKNTATS